ncbi:MAG: aminopeptidase N [Halobacteriovoraceae bacterium]|nr:aminopeptidase N [Halobacteriovoraceae bacterium]|tara:strand:- start:641 stop:3217 length:2577 start_codon:yes stop_codon:yes gene_type:complete
MQEVFLKDYKKPDFLIPEVELTFEIDEKLTHVYSKLKVIPQSQNENLELKGEGLDLVSIQLNGGDCEFTKTKDGLSVSVPTTEFILEIQNTIKPAENFSCEGVYKSGNILCTQNEPEGFRRITYFLDRPDIMSSFKTTLKGSKTQYPYLLSNGNLVDKREEGENHIWVWEDPFPKPCYLFALVAGDLAVIKDTFTTQSGREVLLELYVDHGNEDKTTQAMESLKNSMKWDEQRFRLEYDLDRYMIVAVDSFNMGAMENKGLNIFNSHYVLAKPETATDTDFKNIEAVIGHEYFHNWTGNRVTCRDWFQLTLKEGLTVFRDQEFSSDLGSRTVKRIQDVDTLKNHQFPEDASSLSHPIKPKSYVEMNNFYTATVYEKGAEVIRMIHTLIGEEHFQQGMDLYFQRHDGQAVTTEDFVQAMSDASGQDLEHFKAWYDQSGTPEINITTQFDAAKNEFTLHFEQVVTTHNAQYDCLYMPFHLSLLDEKGKELLSFEQQKFILNQKHQKLVLKDVSSQPVPVFNCHFSAPVIVNYDYSTPEKLHIVKYAEDYYSVYNMMQILYLDQIKSLMKQFTVNGEVNILPDLITAFQSVMENKNIDNELKALILSLPSERIIFENIELYDAPVVDKALEFLAKNIGSHFGTYMDKWIQQTEFSSEYSLNQADIGKRALKNTYFTFLAANKESQNLQKIYDSFKNATNMTEELSAFKVLVKTENEYCKTVKDEFYSKWKSDNLVFQKWVQAQAQADYCDIDLLKHIESLPEFDTKVPNHIRALYAGFITNLSRMCDGDKETYAFLANKILEIDKFNSQIAAGLAKKLNIVKKMPSLGKDYLIQEMQNMTREKSLSNDLREILDKNLKSIV